jgi:hypothetical protein|tara:strand:+ start:101 stop:280 length:180 start_codon:yes stop_codon:yes gene_type:complete
MNSCPQIPLYKSSVIIKENRKIEKELLSKRRFCNFDRAPAKLVGEAALSKQDENFSFCL